MGPPHRAGTGRQMILGASGNQSPGGRGPLPPHLFLDQLWLISGEGHFGDRGCLLGVSQAPRCERAKETELEKLQQE